MSVFDFRLISPDRVLRRMNTGEGVSLVQSYFLSPKSQGFPFPSPAGGGGGGGEIPEFIGGPVVSPPEISDAPGRLAGGSSGV